MYCAWTTTRDVYACIILVLCLHETKVGDGRWVMVEMGLMGLMGLISPQVRGNVPRGTIWKLIYGSSV